MIIRKDYELRILVWWTSTHLRPEEVNGAISILKDVQDHLPPFVCMRNAVWMKSDEIKMSDSKST